MNCLFCFSRLFGYIRSQKRSLNQRIVSGSGSADEKGEHLLVGVW